MDWAKIWSDITNYFETNVWNIVGFFAAFFIGLIVVKIIINIVRRIFAKTKMENITQNFLLGFIRFGLYLIWVLMLLSIIGVQISGIVSALSAAFLAVGLALQNIIASVANGIVIISTHLFKKGDFVEIAGVSGSVVQINFLFTTIMTSDNKRVTIPNSSIVNDAVINYGANKTRRVDFTFSVAYESDVELVKKIVTDVMISNGNVLLEPKAPFCRLKTLGASSIDFFANCWCDNEDYWDVYYYVVENVYNEFKRNNISVPYNQLEIRNRTDEVFMPVIEQPLAKRVEKQRVAVEERFNLETDGISKLLKGHHKNKVKKTQKGIDCENQEGEE